MHKKKVLDSKKNFDIRFSMDLHVLRCPEHDLTIFRKCLCLHVSKIFGHYISRTKEQKLMKLYIQFYFDITQCSLDFGVHRSRSSDNFSFL